MRIAIILPQHRPWRWHQQLIAHLRQAHALEMFVDDRVPPYPRSLQAWLKTELAIYLAIDNERLFPAPDLDMSKYPAATELDEQDFDVIINLAEYANSSLKSVAIAYDGAFDSIALVNRLLARQTPHLTACREVSRSLLAESRPAIDDKSRLSRGLRLSFARCISLLERALKSIGKGRIVEQATAQPLNSTSLLVFMARFIREKMSRAALTRVQRADHWCVAFRNGPGPFVSVCDDAGRYYADPFLFGRQGRNFLFVEEVSHATGKGIISVAEVVGDRLVNVPVPVLERPYHLSYPFVLADDDTIYMLPETGANKSLELYRAVEFPWRWRLDRVLIEGLSLADATPLFHQDRWWLFAAAAEHGGIDQDELLIFHSEKLTGPWRSHSANPVKSDCSSARPAGRIRRQGRRLLRPAQDCEEGYGTALVWLEIMELTSERFREEEIARWDGPHELGVAGIHSFDQIGQLQVIDFRNAARSLARRPSPRQLTPRLGSAIDRVFSVAGAPGALLAERTATRSSVLAP
jgi:hypothetical protein